ncbi:unnamed protein product [Paramecium primaurelia]|uniref:Uncharacterized protein n=1 Tax=Paramecium primaurelia TaxID=5886 RepID=A0A8S1NN54_PARPR|nr:unnamed protein product [Paramecium primaurelia]
MRNILDSSALYQICLNKEIYGIVKNIKKTQPDQSDHHSSCKISIKSYDHHPLTGNATEMIINFIFWFSQQLFSSFILSRYCKEEVQKL